MTTSDWISKNGERVIWTKDDGSEHEVEVHGIYTDGSATVFVGGGTREFRMRATFTRCLSPFHPSYEYNPSQEGDKEDDI